MNGIFEHIQALQLVVSGAAGFVGVGVGIGVFKSTINRVKEDLGIVKRRQAKLRGDDNGSEPLFVSKIDCSALRHQCMNVSNGKMQLVCEDLMAHTKSIKALDNFARWWMQKEGLRISEINEILGK